MIRFVGILFICCMFLASHLVEASQCCNEIDSADYISQDSDCYGHISSATKSDSAEHHDCDLSCHHCHHGFHLSTVLISYELIFSGDIEFNFISQKLSNYHLNLLRPPALS